MCHGKRTRGWDSEQHGRAACRSLPAERPEEWRRSWNTGEMRNASRELEGQTAAGLPFEDLSDDQEAESDGENGPEILGFRKDFAIVGI